MEKAYVGGCSGLDENYETVPADDKMNTNLLQCLRNKSKNGGIMGHNNLRLTNSCLLLF